MKFDNRFEIGRKSEEANFHFRKKLIIIKPKVPAINLHGFNHYLENKATYYYIQIASSSRIKTFYIFTIVPLAEGLVKLLAFVINTSFTSLFSAR